MRKIGIVMVAMLATATFGGCLFLQGDARLTVRNVSDNSNILEIHVKAPGEEEFGENVLNAQVAPGNSTQLNLPAPRRGENADGVTYEIRIRYEIFDVIESSNIAVFSCVHAGKTFEWTWQPGSTPDICVD